MMLSKTFGSGISSRSAIMIMSFGFAVVRPRAISFLCQFSRIHAFSRSVADADTGGSLAMT